jgi:hypothetical protein
MDKITMREWVSSLETVCDNRLRKWKKFNIVQNGGSVNLQWQFEETLIIINITWNDKRESVTFHCIGPQACHRYVFDGLTDKTFNKVCDRVGNLAQVIMHPPIYPLDVLPDNGRNG